MIDIINGIILTDGFTIMVSDNGHIGYRFEKFVFGGEKGIILVEIP